MPPLVAKNQFGPYKRVNEAARWYNFAVRYNSLFDMRAITNLTPLRVHTAAFWRGLHRDIPCATTTTATASSDTTISNLVIRSGANGKLTTMSQPLSERVHKQTFGLSRPGKNAVTKSWPLRSDTSRSVGGKSSGMLGGFVHAQAYGSNRKIRILAYDVRTKQTHPVVSSVSRCILSRFGSFYGFG